MIATENSVNMFRSPHEFVGLGPTFPEPSKVRTDLLFDSDLDILVIIVQANIGLYDERCMFKLLS